MLLCLPPLQPNTPPTAGPQKKRRLDPSLAPADFVATSSAAASRGASFKALPDHWVTPPKTWCDRIDVD
ncbi:hypothetical protein AK812_SmicGene38789 [Symbiodinium microadriaticum]|uniref:Uncharacterized protein n=1 Tax=Symbiodinium microadriaticum TaxID=2951 RepID=A0A1Q9CCV8_SYMMI|nr:hypothetical protein AK812_SmicGene38789 [Symbiodinium microadriaticum]